MKVFRRSQSPDSEAAMVPPGRSEEAVIGVPAHREAGPILVAVDGHRHSWDALEWAAAEAAARQCSLRILHAFHWSPTAVDLGGMSVNAWDAGAEELISNGGAADRLWRLLEKHGGVGWVTAENWSPENGQISSPFMTT